MKLLTICIVLVALVVLGIWFALQEDYGVGVNSVSWLPSEARNITYLKVPVTNTMAEFEIEREAFKRWCLARGMPLRELKSGEEGRANRCLRFLEDRGLIPVVPEPNRQSLEEWLSWYGQRSLKQFEPGDLYFEDRWSNGGGYALGYATKEARGYYWYGHH